MSKKGFTVLPPSIKEWFIRAIDPPIDFFIRLKIHPNFFTILGFLSACLGAYFYAVGQLKWGGVSILIGGMCDTFDGKIARKRGISSKFGALFDSSVDRYAEFAMFFGMGLFFLDRGDALSLATAAVAFLALSGSIMVSYVRARAEGLDFDCKVGMMQRAERIVFLGACSLIHIYALIGMIWIVALLANFTVAQRMFHVWREEKSQVGGEGLDKSLGL